MSTPLATDVEVWSIDGLDLGAVLPDSTGSVVTRVTGWSDGTAPRPARTARTAGAGSYRGPNFRSERIVTLSGWVEVPNEASALRVADRIAAICPDPHVLYPLRHTDSRSGEDRFALVELDARPLAEPMYQERPLRVDYSLQFAAPDHRKYSSQPLTTSTLLAKDAAGGIQWGGPTGSTGIRWSGPAGSTGVEYQTGNGETGIRILTNPGTDYAPVKLYITGGPVTSPSIVLPDGRAIEYGPVLPAGSVLEIDTGAKSVLLDDANQRPLLTRADWFEIPPESSVQIVFRSPIPSPTAELSAVWYPAWL